MSFIIPPVLKAILASADAVAPGRSKASDGTIGDPAHAARTSDHNPDPITKIVHAADVTWDEKFNAWEWAQWLAERCKTGKERRVKYLVCGSPVTGVDMISSPTDSWAWRPNGSPKRDHFNHLHISILSGSSVENSVLPMFVKEPTEEPAVAEPVNLTPETYALLGALIESKVQEVIDRRFETLTRRVHKAENLQPKK